MTPFTVSIIVAAVLILAGLGTCALAGKVSPPFLSKIAYIAGVVLLVVGLLLLLMPPLIWFYHEVLAMFGLGG